jgi:hypothetical protein
MSQNSRRRHARAKSTEDILSLRPLRNAETFFTLIQPLQGQHDPAPLPNGVLQAHVHALDVESQYLLLGLSQALVGYSVLRKTNVDRRAVSYAERLAAYSLRGVYGNCRMDISWFRTAAEFYPHPMPHDVLHAREAHDSRKFFEAVRYYSRLLPAFRMRHVHGYLFPDINTIDGAFAEIDGLCRQVGGNRLLGWINEYAREGRNMPYSLLQGYGVKYIRIWGNAESPLGRLEQVTDHLYHLLQFDHPTKIGNHPNFTAYMLEEITKNVLRAKFIGVRHRTINADGDGEASEFIVRKLGIFPEWKRTRKDLGAPGAWVSPRIGEVIPVEWIHSRPEPNQNFGTSLKTALLSAAYKPLVEISEDRYRVMPEPTVSCVLAGIQYDGIGSVFEEFIRQKLSRLGRVTHGRYVRVENNSNAETGEIDAICCNAACDRMLIFECKAVTEIPETWLGGHHAIVEFFQKGFLRSQEQLLRAERTLREDNILHVSPSRDAWEVIGMPEMILRVTVSLCSFGDLHMSPVGGRMLDQFREFVLKPPPSTKLDRGATNVSTRGVTATAGMDARRSARPRARASAA